MMAQNQVASPPGTENTSYNNNNTNNGTPNKQPMSPNQQRLAVLRAKRQELEKRLQEKNSLLQELCRKEAHLIGVYPTVTIAGQEGQHHPSSSADDIGGLLNSKATSHSTHSLPRKIGTGFTLSEKYLNKRTLSSPLTAPLSSSTSAQYNDHGDVVGGGGGGSLEGDEELNNLLLQRDIQQQICKASLKLLNDTALTKSVRRKHKQSYEVAQMKLLEIGHGLSSIQKQKNAQDHHKHINSQTLPLTVKTNFKVPQGQQYSGGSPVHQQQQQQKRNRHDSYNPHHSPIHHPSAYATTSASADHHSNLSNSNIHAPTNKSLCRSTSNSSSLNNANALGKSSLSLDQTHHHQLQQQQPHYSHHQQSSPTTHHQAKPTSYESKSLHNFVMTSAASYQSPHHHPALLSPTFYSHPNSHFAAMTSSRTAAPPSTHYPSAGGNSLRQQPHQQFMSPPPQQVLIPQSGLGGYWTLNEHNERVWCASSAFSPEPSGPSAAHTGQRPATALDRKAAIYVPNSGASHGKMKMPSPEASPSGGAGTSNPHHPGYAAHHHQDVSHQQYTHQNFGKSFSIPKSTSMGHIEYISSSGGGGRNAEDTASLGSFNSDTNNNPSAYHNLVSAMAAAKVSHYSDPAAAADDDDVGDVDDDDHHDELLQDNVNNNNNNSAAPPPLRPKSSASQHAPEKSWYETSLDKVGGGGGAGGGGSKTAKHGHKPPALLPRELNQTPHQLHIEIPMAPHHQPHHSNHHQQLERSMSHRIVGTSNFSTSASPPPLPPITRQQQQQSHGNESQLQSPGSGHHKKLSCTTASSGGNNGSGNLNAVRRNQSNVPPLMGGQESQLSPALLSPRTGAAGPPLSPALAKVAAAAEEEIQVESPKNVTVVQQGKFLPYKEETKPFEMSDFYKYSTKFRQPAGAPTVGTTGGRGARGNVLYQQEQQQQQRGVYVDLADVANNNNNNNSSSRVGGNSHNNSNGHILQHPKSSNVSLYSQSATASNATAAASEGRAAVGVSGVGGGQYPLSYQQ